MSKSSVDKQQIETNNKRKRNDGKPNKDGRKKKFKRDLKTKSGISHVMSVMREEENKNAPLVSVLQPTLPPIATTSVPSDPTTAIQAATNPLAPTNANISQLSTAFPALSTKLKLNSILKNGS